MHDGLHLRGRNNDILIWGFEQCSVDPNSQSPVVVVISLPTMSVFGRWRLVYITISASHLAFSLLCGNYLINDWVININVIIDV